MWKLSWAPKGFGDPKSQEWFRCRDDAVAQWCPLQTPSLRAGGLGGHYHSTHLCGAAWAACPPEIQEKTILRWKSKTCSRVLLHPITGSPFYTLSPKHWQGLSHMTCLWSLLHSHVFLGKNLVQRTERWRRAQEMWALPLAFFFSLEFSSLAQLKWKVSQTWVIIDGCTWS